MDFCPCCGSSWPFPEVPNDFLCAKWPERLEDHVELGESGA